MTELKGAIFDADGTVLDSMPIWDGVAGLFLLSRGITPRPGLQDALYALGGDQIPAYFREEYGLKTSHAEIKDGINKLVETYYFNDAPLKPGILKVLETLKARKVPCCIATATDGYLIRKALRRLEIDRYFTRVFSCAEEGAGKDRPDIYNKASRHLGTAVSDTAVFEDALYAVRTAKRAGFKVVAVYDESASKDEDEIRAVCDVYYRTFEDWLI